VAQNLRQLGRSELTRSTSAVAETGQADRRLRGHGHSLPSWAPRIPTNEKSRDRGFRIGDSPAMNANCAEKSLRDRGNPVKRRSMVRTPRPLRT
jgi:hypothetical protein